MLLGVRDELRARIDATNARIDETNARIDGTNARIDTLRSELMAEIHRIGTLVEDQATRSRAVYEVVMGHNARFERLERRMDAMEGTLREILDAVKARPSS
jgi:peptidoglycan hydrolase CwlO-like protein